MILHNTPLLVNLPKEQRKVPVDISHATGQEPSSDHKISFRPYGFQRYHLKVQFAHCSAVGIRLLVAGQRAVEAVGDAGFSNKH